MAGKKLSLVFPEVLKRDLCAAIRLYADAAYPVAGSECAQVARAALLDAAQAIDDQFAARGCAGISRRLRGQLNAALDYYADMAGEDGHDISLRIVLLKSALEGEPVSEGQLSDSGQTA